MWTGSSWLIQDGIGLLDIPRVEVFINSSRLSSKLTLDIKLLPITAFLQPQQGMAVVAKKNCACSHVQAFARKAASTKHALH